MKKTNVHELLNEFDNKSGKLAALQTMAYALVAAISVLFLFLAGSFLSSHDMNLRTVPPALSVSSVFIILSTVLVIKLKRLKKDDRYKNFRTVISIVAALGILFFICQYAGWQQLLHHFPSAHRNLLVVLIVAHALHFLIAFLLVIHILYKSYRFENGADFYIHFLDVKQELLFKITCMYWDFLSYLWVILFIIIQLKFMLQ